MTYCPSFCSNNKKETVANLFRFCNGPFFASKGISLRAVSVQKKWYLGRDLNPYSVLQKQILSLLRLPIPPPRHLTLYKIMYFSEKSNPFNGFF